MAVTYKVLGQQESSVSTLTALYAVPAGTSAISSTLVVNDVGGLGGNFAVSIAVGNAADSLAQYLYGSPTAGLWLDPTDTFIATIGITLAAGDVVYVRNISAGSTKLTFQLFGSEIS